MDQQVHFSAEEYLGILELQFEVAQALKGKPSSDSRWPDAQHLALKLFAHGASAHWLFQGTNAPVPRSTVGAAFTDFGSIAVIARAALETYLTLFEVFVSPSTEDEFEFQYSLWHLAGQVVLEDLEPSDESLVENYLGAQADIAELRERIQATDVFAGLTQRQQEQVLQGRRRRNWSEIAASAGIGLGFIKRIYSYYSGFVHSDALTSSQLFTAQTREDQRGHAELHLLTIMFALSKFILDYVDLFEEAAQVLPRFPEAHSKAQVWSEVLSRLD
jgi:hypothetical protein